MTIEEKDQLRADCLDDISRPGKFEGEPIFSPYFYAQSLDSTGTEFVWPDETVTVLIELESADWVLFPELAADSVAVTISESDSGFVYCQELTRRQVMEFETNYQDTCDDIEEND